MFYIIDGFKEEQFSSAHLGHLGLVADKIDSLKIIDLIDNRLTINEAHGAKLSHGERIAAMIMNGLGFIDSRLYLFPEFLCDKGHDIGSGEINIFIHTDYPLDTFKEIIGVLKNENVNLKDIKIAYREMHSDNYNVLWPKDLTKFHIV